MALEVVTVSAMVRLITAEEVADAAMSLLAQLHEVGAASYGELLSGLGIARTVVTDRAMMVLALSNSLLRVGDRWASRW